MIPRWTELASAECVYAKLTGKCSCRGAPPCSTTKCSCANTCTLPVLCNCKGKYVKDNPIDDDDDDADDD